MVVQTKIVIQSHRSQVARTWSQLIEKSIPYLLIAPVCILMVLLYAYPLFILFYQSLHHVSLLGADTTFVGLRNYEDLLSDPSFYTTLLLTVKYTLLTVALKISFGYALAAGLSSRIYFKKFLTFLTLIPWAIPQVVAALLWQWILDGHYGYLNYILNLLHLTTEKIPFLSDPSLALISVALVDAWLGIPFVAMIFLGGMQGIPQSLYDAARIDGAGIFRRFISITLPCLKKLLLVTTTLVTIWTFNSFNVIFALTNGGPMRATETLIIRIYQEAFANFNLGLSSALAVIVFFILMSFILIYYQQITNANQDRGE